MPAVAVGRRRPGQCRAVGVGRVGGGERQSRGLATVDCGRFGERAEPVDRAGRAELRGPESVDEVTAAAPPGVLEGGEHLVDPGKPTQDPFADDGAADHHPVPGEQPLGGGMRAPGGIGIEGRQQRPTAGRLGWSGAGHPAGSRWWPPAAVARGARPGEGAQRRERVVADAPGPDQVPQRAAHGRVGQGDHAQGGADRVDELAEEPGPARRERVEHCLVQLGVLEGLGLGQGERRLVGEVQADPAVGPRQRGVTGPDDLACGGQLVEVGGLVVAHPRAQDEWLQGRGRHRAAGKLVDDAHDAVDPA